MSEAFAILIRLPCQVLFPTNQLEPNLDQAFAVLCVPTVSVTKESVEKYSATRKHSRQCDEQIFYYVFDRVQSRDVLSKSILILFFFSYRLELLINNELIIEGLPKIVSAVD